MQRKELSFCGSWLVLKQKKRMLPVGGHIQPRRNIKLSFGGFVRSLYRFENAQSEDLIMVKENPSNEKEKGWSCYKQINVIAESEQQARIKCARKVDGGVLPDSYLLAMVFPLNKDWN